MGDKVVERPEGWALSAPREVRVTMVKGNLSITRTDRDPVCEVTGVSGRPLLVTEEGGVVTIGYQRGVASVPMPFSRLLLLRRDRVDVTLTVPVACAVTVTAVDATVSVSGGEAPVDIRATAGDVTLVGVSGPAVVATGRGLVRAVGGSGDLDVNIHAGDLTVVRGRGRQTHAHTVHGSVTVDLEGTEVTSMDLRCKVGDITVRLPASSDLRMELVSAHGEISSGFPGVTPSRTGSGAAADGVLGVGTGRLVARNDFGRIAVLSAATVAGGEEVP
jgi:hypothetical protein